MSQIQQTDGNSLVLHSDQSRWNEEQLTALRHLGVEKASDADLKVFLHVSQRTGLDPFARQIYMIERQGKQTIQTGIDGFRLVARRAVDRSGEALAIASADWCGPDGKWHDVWLDTANPPAAARVTVTRGSGDFTAVALWQEYVQFTKQGDITRMWATRGAGQLAKCAEALALRKAFPMDLAGVYTDDEMAAASNQHAGGPSRGRSRVAAALAEQSPSQGSAVAAESGELLDTSSDLAHEMYRLIKDMGVSPNEVLPYISGLVGRTIQKSADMTVTEAQTVVAEISAALADPFPNDESTVIDGEVLEG